MSQVQQIAVIPGYGIGVEVTAAARQVLDAVAARPGVARAYDEFDWSCGRYLETGAIEHSLAGPAPTPPPRCCGFGYTLPDDVAGSGEL